MGTPRVGTRHTRLPRESILRYRPGALTGRVFIQAPGPPKLLRGFQPDVLVGVMVENCRVPAAHTGLDEEDSSVVVDRDDGHLVEKDCLRLLEQFVAGFLVPQAGGLLEQAVIFGVRPTGAVVATIGEEGFEER